MDNGPDWPQRRSPRLNGFDYAHHAAYFVTICIQHRVCLLGDVVEEEMRLNAAGLMVKEWWEKLAVKFAGVVLDTYSIMPNHVHGIVALLGDRAELSLIEVMQWFKTMTTNAYIRGVRQEGWIPFPGRLWQSSFYDHIIRHDEALTKIRDYISNNPLKWQLDKDNPDNFG